MIASLQNWEIRAYAKVLKQQALAKEERNLLDKIRQTMADAYSESEKLSRAIARIHAGMFALVFALIGGSSLFIMTVWLIS